MSTYLYERKALPCFATKAESINLDKRTLEAVVSSDIVDRDGEVIQPKAFKARVASFQKNPVFLWNHDPFTPPIGKVLSLDIGAKAIEATFQFRPAGDDALADNVFRAYAGGFLTSFSIGFRVWATEKAEVKPDGTTKPMTVTDAELFEISAVTIPANTDAVVKAKDALGVVEAALFGAGATAKTLYSAPSDLQVLQRAAELVRRAKAMHAKVQAVQPQEAEALEQLAAVVLAHTFKGEGVHGEGEELRQLAEALGSICAA